MFLTLMAVIRLQTPQKPPNGGLFLVEEKPDSRTHGPRFSSNWAPYSTMLKNPDPHPKMCEIAKQYEPNVHFFHRISAIRIRI